MSRKSKIKRKRKRALMSAAELCRWREERIRLQAELLKRGEEWLRLTEEQRRRQAEREADLAAFEKAKKRVDTIIRARARQR